jgi:hypothetical protein
MDSSAIVCLFSQPPPPPTTRARIYRRLRESGNRFRQHVAWRASTKNRVVYLPVRLDIDSWAPQKAYKYGLCTWGEGRKTTVKCR